MTFIFIFNILHKTIFIYLFESKLSKNKSNQNKIEWTLIIMMFLLSLKKFEKGFRSKSFKNKFNQKNSNELKSKQNQMHPYHHDVSFIIDIKVSKEINKIILFIFISYLFFITAFFSSIFFGFYILFRIFTWLNNYLVDNLKISD